MSVVAQSSLGDIADLQAGVGFPVDLQGRSSGDYPVAKVGDISRVGRSGEAVISSADHFIDEADLARLRAKPIPAGSVLFAKIGEAIRQNHRVIAGCALLVDNNAMAAIPTKKVESRYLYHFLRTVDFYALASATTVPALRKSELERLPVPLPPLPEQRRIAEILDKADALRAKRRTALAQLDILTQSIFLDLFGDPATNPMGWHEKEIGDVALEVYRYPTYYDIAYVEDGVPEVRGELLNTDGSISTDRARLRFISQETSARFPKTVLAAGDLVMTVRGTIGKIGLVPPELAGANMTANLIRIALDQKRLDPVFAWHSTQTSHFKAQLSAACASTTILTIKAPDLKRIRIALPPIDLQREFSGRVKALKNVEAAQSASQERLGALFGSLQDRAFRGDL